MNKLLYIESSPRKERSHSSTVAHAILEAYKVAHPNDNIVTRNLWEQNLPSFDGATIEAKYAVLSGAAHTPVQAVAWARVKAIFEEFSGSDKLLFSIPMWNRCIPYILKHYIDVITQPGLAFSYAPEIGYQPLLMPKPVAIVYSSAGDYSDRSPLRDADFQKPYFEQWLQFIGLSDLRSIIAAPTIGTDDVVAHAKASSMELAQKLGQHF